MTCRGWRHAHATYDRWLAADGITCTLLTTESCPRMASRAHYLRQMAGRGWHHVHTTYDRWLTADGIPEVFELEQIRERRVAVTGRVGLLNEDLVFQQ